MAMSAFLIDPYDDEPGVSHVLVDEDELPGRVYELLSNGCTDYTALQIVPAFDDRQCMHKGMLVIDTNRMERKNKIFYWGRHGVIGRALVMSRSKDGTRIKSARCTIGDVREAVRFVP